MPRAMLSFDPVDAVMVLEEVLDIEIPDYVAERCGSPRKMVDTLEQHLSNQPLTPKAAELLTGLANQNNHKLADGLDGVWRREQIAAIVHELFRDWFVRVDEC